MENFTLGCNEVLEITQDYVADLVKLWMECFGERMCLENLQKLTEHAKSFYEELIAQSEEKRALIKKEIHDLREEAINLQRLLKIDVSLPQLHSDTPLIYMQAEMDKSMEDLRECLRARRQEICDLLSEQEQLCEHLGEAPRQLLSDPLPTAEELKNFRVHLTEMDEERLKRIQKLTKLRRGIKSNLKILELQVNTDKELHLLNEHDVKLSKETFAALEAMHEDYEEQVQELKSRIDDMHRKLHTLWDRLNTSQETRDKYSRYVDCNQTNYDKLYEELQRCEALKHKNLKLYVQQIRQEIQEWWEKTLMSEAQRQRFSNFQNQCYTDDLLLLHEMELDELQQHYKRNERIFQLFEDRKILWARKIALEAKANDPGRFTNRGGQLLKEEKERKTIASKLPKIEQQIQQMAHEYEKREHKPFLVYGQNVVVYMSNEWERERQQKENECSARKKAQLTPKNTGRTPMSLRNASTASATSLRRTPSIMSVSSKRCAATVSSQKRKLHPTEHLEPVAKRSLMQAFSSPGTFLRPGVKAMSNDKKSQTPLKKQMPRVLASSIARRRSGRRSSGVGGANAKTAAGISKKRLSGKKLFKKPLPPQPKIKVIQCSSDEFTDCGNSDDTYNSFERSIEPASRSTLSQSISTDSARKRRFKNAQRLFERMEDDLTTEEFQRLKHLPDPREALKKNF